MAKLETKYAIGDVVYHASTTQERGQHPCPDCLGSRKWKAVSPAGGEYEFTCPRCTTGYRSDNELSLTYTKFAPSVSRLTIGSVRFDSQGRYPHTGPSVEYMCNETGVGSGNVYSEGTLFETKEEALAAATLKASEATTNVEWIAGLYNKTLELSDYQLDSAKVRVAKEMELRSGSMLYGIGDLLRTIREASDWEAIIEAVDDYERWDWHRDKERLAQFRDRLLAEPSQSDHEHQQKMEWAGRAGRLALQDGEGR